MRYPSEFSGARVCLQGGDAHVGGRNVIDVWPVKRLRQIHRRNEVVVIVVWHSKKGRHHVSCLSRSASPTSVVDRSSPRSEARQCGQAPGVQVASSSLSGAPGSDFSVRVRGIASAEWRRTAVRHRWRRRYRYPYSSILIDIESTQRG